MHWHPPWLGLGLTALQGLYVYCQAVLFCSKGRKVTRERDKQVKQNFAFISIRLRVYHNLVAELRCFDGKSLKGSDGRPT